MAKKKRNTPRRACFLDRCHHRSRSIPLGTPTCNLPASFPSKRLLRHDVHIGILVGRTRAVSSLGLVTFADGCPMRPIPPGHCPHRGPISSNRTPDSMGFDAHRTPPPMGILPEADGGGCQGRPGVLSRVEGSAEFTTWPQVRPFSDRARGRGPAPPRVPARALRSSCFTSWYRH